MCTLSPGNDTTWRPTTCTQLPRRRTLNPKPPMHDTVDYGGKLNKRRFVTATPSLRASALWALGTSFSAIRTFLGVTLPLAGGTAFVLSWTLSFTLALTLAPRGWPCFALSSFGRSSGCSVVVVNIILSCLGLCILYCLVFRSSPDR